MTELKEKFIEALKAMDFSKLTLSELETAANISTVVNNFHEKSCDSIWDEALKKIFERGNDVCCCAPDRTLSELKEG